MQKIFSRELRFRDEEGKEWPEWEVRRLGEIGTFFSGGTPETTKSHFYTGDIPFIKSGEINSDQTEQFISEEGLKNSSAKKVQKAIYYMPCMAQQVERLLFLN
ncbi:MAG: restriction endonuclease subunit S [Saprospirales bacterium]|nr:restriction endonuclease subunit S [Saprospirales bacterium]